MVQIQPTYEHAPVLEIPPTGVRGWFRSNLHTSTHRVLESHPREWVDGSDPTYLRSRRVLESHPREWVDGSDPTYLRSRRVLESHQREVGGLFRSGVRNKATERIQKRVQFI